jgi:hypothetical protein
MHRRITIQGDGAAVSALARDLAPLAGVIGLAHQRGGSLKPPGDVLEIDVLNRYADEVLRRARPAQSDDAPPVVVVLAQSSAIIDRSRRELIDNDADEALWEEMESDLRNHGRISTNYLVLMALGGLIAASGFVVDAVSQAIALVGASIIAPGFEPVAKLAQGLVLGAPRVCLRAVVSILLGYAVLFSAALLLMGGMRLLHLGHPHQAIMAQPVLKVLTHFEPAPLVTSAAAAVAGVMMVVSLRDLYVVGPLMVLVAVSGVALAGAAVAIGEGQLALRALGRVGIDLLMIVVLGGGIFYWKQRRFHRRRPLT